MGPMERQRVEVHGSEMAYLEVGEGDPIVFLHGNPTSSYLWRNVLPHIADMGRCIAPDLIGMGDSSKVEGLAYRFVDHRSYLDAFLDALGDHDMVPMGSSLKFCLVAEGRADFYPRLGPTSEWDTGAAHAVVLAAGGKIVTLEGEPLSYNRKESFLNPEFLVIADQSRDWLTPFQGS